MILPMDAFSPLWLASRPVQDTAVDGRGGGGMLRRHGMNQRQREPCLRMTLATHSTPGIHSSAEKDT